MAIPLAGAGGLFTRLGHLIAGLNEHNTARGATLNARLGTVRGDFTAAEQDVMDGALAAVQGWQATDQLANQFKTWAQNTLLRMAQDDGWPGTTVAQALEYLRVQMQGAGTMLAPASSILKPTVGITVAAVGGNVGNGVCRGTVVSPVDALALDYALADAAPLVCTAHAYPGGTTQSGAETFAWAGQVAARSVLAPEWPLGAGGGATMNALSSTAGVVANGDFESWAVANVPDSWAVMAGLAGSTILKGNSPYSAAGTFNLQFVGDGATLHRVRQLVNLNPQRAYSLNWFHKVTAAPGAGSVRVRLEDLAGNPVLDQSAQAGTNSISVALAGIGVNYVSAGGWFYTPRLLPSTGVYLAIDITGAALANAGVFNLDRLVMAEGTQLYQGGPFLATFAGNVDFAVGDQFTVTVTNNFGVATLARGLDRLWDLRANGVRVPSRAVADGGTTTNAVVV